MTHAATGKELLRRMALVAAAYTKKPFVPEPVDKDDIRGSEFIAGYVSRDPGADADQISAHLRLYPDEAWIELDAAKELLPVKEIIQRLKDVGELKEVPQPRSTLGKASYIFAKLKVPKPVKEALDHNEAALREVLLALVPFVQTKFKQTKVVPRDPKSISADDRSIVKQYIAEPFGSLHPEVVVSMYDENYDRTLEPTHYIKVYGSFNAANANPITSAKQRSIVQKLTWDIEHAFQHLSRSRLLSIGRSGDSFKSTLQVHKLAEVNSTMRVSFKDYLNEAKKRASTKNIDVVDVGAAIEEHRELSKKLAVATALAKKMGQRVHELEALVLPIVKDTEAQQLTIDKAIIKFDTRKTTGVSYKSAFEKALELVNEEQREVLKAFLETVTNRDVKEYIEVVDTEVAALLDRVKAAEKADDSSALERIMADVLKLSSSIKEGRFTDHVVKSFGWVHLSELFGKLRDRIRGMRKKLDWLEHVADHPAKFGG